MNKISDYKYHYKDIIEINGSKNDEFKKIYQNYINNSNNFNQNDFENNHNLEYLNYPERNIEILNAIRKEFYTYSHIIEDSIKNIIENNNKMVLQKIK